MITGFIERIMLKSVKKYDRANKMALKFNVEKLNELLKDFYILTKMRIVIFDDAFNEIIAYPKQPCPLCVLIRTDSQGREGCRHSDINACRTSLAKGELHIYKCHAGLTEACAPIKVGDVVMGYMMFGQITDTRNKQLTVEAIADKCRKYRIDPDAVRMAAFRLGHKADSQVKAAAKIMESCACYLWFSELVSIAQESLAYKLDNHINSHIADDLSVDKLCEVLDISRSKLYEIAWNQYGTGIADHIRSKRIKHACKLLDNDMLVKQICPLIGIGDYNYFSKMFKRYVGCTPREYKRGRSFLAGSRAGSYA
jgi:ligand-binding sensor protein